MVSDIRKLAREGLSYEDSLLTIPLVACPLLKEEWERGRAEWRLIILRAQLTAALAGNAKVLVALGEHYLGQGIGEEDIGDIELVFDDLPQPSQPSQPPQQEGEMA